MGLNPLENALTGSGRVLAHFWLFLSNFGQNWLFFECNVSKNNSVLAEIRLNFGKKLYNLPTLYPKNGQILTKKWPNFRIK